MKKNIIRDIMFMIVALMIISFTYYGGMLVTDMSNTSHQHTNVEVVSNNS